MSKLASDKGYNPFYEIDELPFTDDQKEMVLEWLAQKIWRTFDEEGHCKTYDPLLIEGDVAHSYVFNFDDGGRHHSFKDYAHLEKMLEQEMKEWAAIYARRKLEQL